MAGGEFAWDRGTDTTFARCSPLPLGFDQWYGLLGSLIDSVSGRGVVSFVDNGYRRFPGVFVTDGIQGLLRGKEFSVWSDVPGEIILIHGQLSATEVEEVCESLRAGWAELAAR